MTTQEKNEIIAKWMGAEFERKQDIFHADRFNEYWIIRGNAYNQYRDKETKYWYTAVQLRYHESWDWLMPVVEKIYNDGHYTQITIATAKTVVSISSKDESGKMWTRRAVIEEDESITAVYNAVIKFIDWHNNQG